MLTATKANAGPAIETTPATEHMKIIANEPNCSSVKSARFSTL